MGTAAGIVRKAWRPWERVYCPVCGGPVRKPQDPAAHRCARAARAVSDGMHARADLEARPVRGRACYGDRLADGFGARSAND